MFFNNKNLKNDGAMRLFTPFNPNEIMELTNNTKEIIAQLQTTNPAIEEGEFMAELIQQYLDSQQEKPEIDTLSNAYLNNYQDDSLTMLLQIESENTKNLLITYSFTEGKWVLNNIEDLEKTVGIDQ